MELAKFNINAIKDERDYVAEQLRHSSAVSKVYPSNANFILFKIENAKDVYHQLAERGIIVRYRGDEPLCDDCLRVTVGMPDENVKFLKALKEIVG
jgi:histidinol-phosphate aminotransferase